MQNVIHIFKKLKMEVCKNALVWAGLTQTAIVSIIITIIIIIKTTERQRRQNQSVIYANDLNAFNSWLWNLLQNAILKR